MEVSLYQSPEEHLKELFKESNERFLKKLMERFTQAYLKIFSQQCLGRTLRRISTTMPSGINEIIPEKGGPGAFKEYQVVSVVLS